MISTFHNTLQNPAVGNLFLLFAAIIGVGGNYWLYIKKRSHRRDTLRLALLSELTSMQPTIRDLDYQSSSAEMDTGHPEYFLSNNVYDGNSGNLGVLTEEEVIAIVDFYTQAAKVQAVGKRDPKNIFIEASDRQLYELLYNAINEVEKHVELEDSSVESIDEPISTYTTEA